MLEECDTVSDIVHEASHMSIIIPIIDNNSQPCFL